MKKNKIILLTVLLMLAIYCGAVVFVTKPDTFAFSGILGDYNVISGTDKAHLMEEVGTMIDGKIDAAVNGRIVPYVDSSIEGAVSSAVEGAVDSAVGSAVDSMMDTVAASVADTVTASVTESVASSVTASVTASLEAQLDGMVDEKVNAQVAKAFEALEAKLSSEKDALVTQLMAQIEASSMVEKEEASSYVDPADYVDTLLPELVPAVVAELEKNLDEYAPYIVKALVPELLTYEDALAMDMYAKYRDSLVLDITPEIVLGIMDRLEDEVFTFVGAVPKVPALADSVKVVVNVKSSDSSADVSASEVVADVVASSDETAATASLDVDAVVAELEKNLSSYAPYVADAVLPELEKDLEKYLPYIVDAVLKAMPELEVQSEPETQNEPEVQDEPETQASTETEVQIPTETEVQAESSEVSSSEAVEEEVPSMTASQYDAIREETRRTEIDNILSQLQD